ncbi:MAG: S41 family peptidase [Firmicutes bacterium]|nr:S41 family peptidase [Bacillota bacterium]
MTRWLGKQVGRHWMWVLALGTALVYAPLAGRTGEEKAKQRRLDQLAEIMGVIQKESVEPPPARRVTHAAIQGMLHTLDPHSNYMDEDEFRLMRDDQRGTFFGIGSIIQQQPDGIAVVSTVRGGPSEKAGIRPGDYIREIDGKSTEGWTTNQAVQKLHGDKGTVVEVALQRNGTPDLIRMSLTRAEIPSNSVYYSFMLTPTTGFINIRDFGETTSDEFEKALAELKRQGMKELILDLRDNPGGLVDAAVGVCRQLLGPDQVVVTQRGRNGVLVSETRTPKGDAQTPFPLVVLINRGSASSSEIVSGAIQDHDRGLLVGQTSWGKGLVQVVLSIGRVRGLALTTARYYTPSGRTIQRDYQHGLDDYLMPEEAKDGKEAPPKGPEFATSLGRKVYGGGGITPDYMVPMSTLTPFVATLRYRYYPFFKFAVAEHESHGVKAGEVPDEAVMARFRTWAQGQKIPISDAEWADPKNYADIRELIAIELQNVAYGVEAGRRYFSARDPQVQKALAVMGEAEALMKQSLALNASQPKP